MPRSRPACSAASTASPPPGVSFFLSIPALLAAGLFELKDALGGSISVGETLVGTVVAFLVAYASIAWLLKFVAHHAITWFIPYRVGLWACCSSCCWPPTS